jgi:hypothetical protein
LTLFDMLLTIGVMFTICAIKDLAFPE